ncbi:hypothetical protein BH09BAC6_BH09BAC6_18610 [soil metagenome]|jgi:hypothetical protein
MFLCNGMGPVICQHAKHTDKTHDITDKQAILLIVSIL